MDSREIENCIAYFSNGSQSIKHNIERNKNNRGYKRDLRFYRKRIFNLYKGLMTKKIENEELRYVFEQFNKKAIEYLKFEDKAFILQEEYKDISNTETKNQSINNSISNVTDRVNISNHILIQKTNVKTKNIETLMNIKKNTIKEQENTVLPRQKIFNLTEEKFRHKGTKQNIKKNINNKYEEQNSKT